MCCIALILFSLKIDPTRERGHARIHKYASYENVDGMVTIYSEVASCCFIFPFKIITFLLIQHAWFTACQFVFSRIIKLGTKFAM